MSPEPIRIFLVDDHPLVREWLGQLLSSEPGFEVIGQAEDAAPGLAAITANVPDIAIVDLSLRNGSGLDLIKELREKLPIVQVIVLSMHEELAHVERALRAGAAGYVMKRESTTRIVEAIRAVRAGRVYANPEVLARLAERMVGRRQGGAAGTVDTLSDRELEVFRRMGEGHATKRIASDLGVSMKTVQEYQARIKEKLGLADATELMRAAVRWTEGVL
ncbi:MAG: response regulator transcription factor [Candidatus Didemnitutus sp.]|nr:response regulator transcription factor [Candidatus Didemnitutus sp.]